MPRFQIKGADRATGADAEMVVDADTEVGARVQAQQTMLIESIKEVKPQVMNPMLPGASKGKIIKASSQSWITSHRVKATAWWMRVLAVGLVGFWVLSCYDNGQRRQNDARMRLADDAGALGRRTASYDHSEAVSAGRDATEDLTYLILFVTSTTLFITSFGVMGVAEVLRRAETETNP